MKYDEGVILIEMLVCVFVISFIMFLMLNLMTMLAATTKYQRVISKQFQVSRLVTEDVLKSTNIYYKQGCLNILENDDVIEYCVKGQDLVRTVNSKGYERIISKVDSEFIVDEKISLKVKFDDYQELIPLWSKDE